MTDSVTAVSREVRRSIAAATVLCLVIFIALADAQLKTLLIEPLRTELQLTDTQLGHLNGSVIAIFGVIAAFPVGWLADRFGRRYVLAICTLVWSGATYAAGLATSFEALSLAMIMLAIGESALVPIVYAMPIQVVARRHLAAVNVVVYASVVLSGSVSLMLGGLLFGWIETHRELLPWQSASASWRLMFYLMAIPGVVIAMLVLVLRDHPSAAGSESSAPVSNDAPSSRAPLLSFVRFLRERGLSVVLVYVAIGCVSMAWVLPAMWMPAILKRSFGVGVAEAGASFGAAMLLASAIGLLTGLWWVTCRLPKNDPLANMRLCRNGCAMALAPMVLAPMAPSAATLLLAIGSVVCCLVIAAAQGPTILQQIAPPAFLSRTLALSLVVMLPMRAGIPLLVGVISDRLGTGMPNGLLYALAGVNVALLCAGVAILSKVGNRYAELAAFSRRFAEQRSARLIAN